MKDDQWKSMILLSQNFIGNCIIRKYAIGIFLFYVFKVTLIAFLLKFFLIKSFFIIMALLICIWLKEGNQCFKIFEGNAWITVIILTYIYLHKISKMHLNIKEDLSEGEMLLKMFEPYLGKNINLI